MKEYLWLNLQLLGGEGSAGDGGDAGGNSGVTADAAGQQDARLRELGVPEEKLAKHRAQRQKAAAPTVAKVEAQAEDNQQVAAAEKSEPTPEEGTTKRMTWDEIMADPEYNQHMRDTITARLKESKAAEENLKKLAPGIEVLARKYGLDAENMDYDALSKAINDDDSYYEEKALQWGVNTEMARKLDQAERDKARADKEAKARQEQQQEDMRQQMFREHIAKLEQQGNELKKRFPTFDLRAELNNPAFARMTAPGSPLSVEDAYFAVHRKEIQAAQQQVTAQQTARKMSAAIASGMNRPAEAGTSGQAPSVTTFDYKAASKEQREALKRRIRQAAANGEKLYPGR